MSTTCFKNPVLDSFFPEVTWRNMKPNCLFFDCNPKLKWIMYGKINTRCFALNLIYPPQSKADGLTLWGPEWVLTCSDHLMKIKHTRVEIGLGFERDPSLVLGYASTYHSILTKPNSSPHISGSGSFAIA